MLLSLTTAALAGPLAGMDFVRVPSGTFVMGTAPGEPFRFPDEPAHEVRLTRDYWVATTEVTQAQWNEVMRERPMKRGARIDGRTYAPCGAAGEGGDFPVFCVTWEEAVVFCNRLSRLDGLDRAYRRERGAWRVDPDSNGYRLPTEAEWERAARGPDDVGPWSGGADWDPVGWTQATSERTDLHPVAQKAPNGFALYDMSGNVAEWVEDVYGPLGTESVTDPTGPAAGQKRVSRGGTWYLSPAHARVSARLEADPEAEHSGIGLRVVRTAD